MILIYAIITLRLNNEIKSVHEETCLTDNHEGRFFEYGFERVITA